MDTIKNNHTSYKIWEIFKPFIIYYFLYSASFLLMVSLCQAVAKGLGSEYQTYLAEHAETVTGLVSGLAMLTGILPLIPMLQRELAEHKRSAKAAQESASGAEAEMAVVFAGGNRRGEGSRSKRSMALSAALTAILAASSSVGLNVLLALTGLVKSSASYQDVARQQYGVVFGIGAVLFGLIAPVTEEIVFRGLIFNRMRRYYPHMAAVIVSGVLFGIYHGNLVQGVYGGCMGMLMAYLYERLHSFFVPCLFHAVANLTVYTIAQSAAVHGKVFTLSGCAALFLVSAGCVWGVEKMQA